MTNLIVPTVRNISPDFRQRVPQIDLLDPPAGTSYYRLIQAEYVQNGARRFGPDHHMLIEVLDGNGNRQMNVAARQTWGANQEHEAVVYTNKVGGPYAVDHAMYESGWSYGLWIGDDRARSDYVFGMGLGRIGSEGLEEHVDYYLVYQLTSATGQPQPTEPSMTARQHIEAAERHLAAAKELL